MAGFHIDGVEFRSWSIERRFLNCTQHRMGVHCQRWTEKNVEGSDRGPL